MDQLVAAAWHLVAAVESAATIAVAAVVLATPSQDVARVQQVVVADAAEVVESWVSAVAAVDRSPLQLDSSGTCSRAAEDVVDATWAPLVIIPLLAAIHADAVVSLSADTDTVAPSSTGFVDFGERPTVAAAMSDVVVVHRRAVVVAVATAVSLRAVAVATEVEVMQSSSTPNQFLCRKLFQLKLVEAASIDQLQRWSVLHVRLA